MERESSGQRSLSGRGAEIVSNQARTSSSSAPVSIPLFTGAAQPDIVRASQKDDMYLGLLMEGCHDAVRRVLGPHAALVHSEAIAASSRLLYYGATTGYGLQTLGEEYCDLLPVSAGVEGLPPTVFQRGLLVLLQAVGPALAERLTREEGEELGRWEARRGNGGVAAEEGAGRWTGWLACQREAGMSMWQAAKRRLVGMGLPLSQLITLAGRAHLALFYFGAAYYYWTYRMARVRFLFVGRLLQGRPSYSLLGVFLAAQVVLAVGRLLPGSASTLAGDAAISAAHAKVLPDPWQHPVPAGGAIEPKSDQVKREGSGRCALCLSARRDPTATSCGHIFCWDCISEWCNQKLECPLCRSDINPVTLVPIYNADSLYLYLHPPSVSVPEEKHRLPGSVIHNPPYPRNVSIVRARRPRSEVIEYEK